MRKQRLLELDLSDLTKGLSFLFLSFLLIIK